MGIFDLFSKGFNQGRRRAVDEAFQKRKEDVKLVKPSVGRVVRLEVTEPNDILAQKSMKRLISSAKVLGQSEKVTDRIIQITFESVDEAEAFRKNFGRKI